MIEAIDEASIFADDHYFSRHTAYVESQDGLDPETYRADFHGGIWQVRHFVFLCRKTMVCLLSKNIQIFNNAYQ